MPGRLETEFRAKREAGRKLLVPYITGGYPGWQDAIRACAANGADAVEIGIPFSDPVMDGPVIQQASQAALEAGVTPQSVLDEVPGLDVEIPLAVMTYYNLVHHPGPERFAANLQRAGVAAAILPDLPLEESDPWCTAAEAHGIEAQLQRPRMIDCRGSRREPADSSTQWDFSASRANGHRSPKQQPTWPRGSRQSPTSRCWLVSACRTPSRHTRPPELPTE